MIKKKVRKHIKIKNKPVKEKKKVEEELQVTRLEVDVNGEIKVKNLVRCRFS